MDNLRKQVILEKLASRTLYEEARGADTFFEDLSKTNERIAELRARVSARRKLVAERQGEKGYHDLYKGRSVPITQTRTKKEREKMPGAALNLGRGHYRGERVKKLEKNYTTDTGTPTGKSGLKPRDESREAQAIRAATVSWSPQPNKKRLVKAEKE